jgi:hypothetical protein
MSKNSKKIVAPVVSAPVVGWVSPKSFLQGRKLEVGEILDPVKLGMPVHPTFGPLPTLKVTVVKEDGSLLEGNYCCTEEGCGELLEIHAGDWFQVRRCKTHQRRAARAKSSKRLNPEVKAVKEAERIKAKAERDAVKAQEKATKAAARAQAIASKQEEKAKALEAAAAAKVKAAQEKLAAVTATK